MSALRELFAKFVIAPIDTKPLDDAAKAANAAEEALRKLHAEQGRGGGGRPGATGTGGAGRTSHDLQPQVPLTPGATGLPSVPRPLSNKDDPDKKKEKPSLGGTIGSLIMGWGAKAMISDMISTGAEIGKLSARLGMSAHDFQQWSYVLGLSSEEASIAVKTMSDRFAGAAVGTGEGAKTLARLGIATRDASGKVRSFGDALPDVAEAFGKIDSPAEKTAAALDLFGEAGIKMLPALSKGRDGIAELRRAFEENGGGFSDEAVAGAKKSAAALKQVKLQMTSVRGAIAEAILPSVAWLITSVGGATRALLNLAKGTNVFKIAAVVAGAVAAKAFLPFILEWAIPAITIAAVVMLIDDLLVAAKGGKSVIGDFFDSFLGANSVPRMVEAITEAFWDVIEAIGDAITAVGDYIEISGRIVSGDFEGAAKAYNDREAALVERDQIRADVEDEKRQAKEFAAQVTAGEAVGPTAEQLGIKPGDRTYRKKTKEKLPSTPVPVGFVGPTEAPEVPVIGGLAVDDAVKNTRPIAAPEWSMPIKSVVEAPSPAATPTNVVAPVVNTTNNFVINGENPADARRKWREVAGEVFDEKLQDAMASVPRG